MAETIVDAGPVYLGNAAATIITATNTVILSKLHVVNGDSSDHTLTVSIGTDGAGKRIYETYTVRANGGILDDTGPYKLDAAEVLQAYADAANKMTIYVCGVDLGV